MTTDLEAQKDELEALQSIYDEEFKLIADDKNLGGRFFAYVELPSNFKVIARLLPFGSEILKVQANNAHITESFEVEKLPPLELNLILPVKYPSEEMPDYSLSCKWLAKRQIMKLCQHLNYLWEENKGMEILFTWTQFLKEETLSFLKIDKFLDVSIIYTKQIVYLEKNRVSQERRSLKQADESQLSKALEPQVSSSAALPSTQTPSGSYVATTHVRTSHKLPRPFRRQNRSNQRYEGPRKEKCQVSSEVNENRLDRQLEMRAVFELPMTEPICKYIQEFDQQQRKLLFEKAIQECIVCFSSKPGAECIKFDSCGHIFCKDCSKGYFEVQVRDGNVKNLKCLQDKCNTEATPAEVRSVLSAEMFAKYDSTLLAVTLDTLSDIVYCPRRACQYPVSLEPDENMGRCPSCQFVFCIYCKMTYHGVAPCQLKSEEQQKLVKEYNNGSEAVRSDLERRYGRRQLQKLVDNVLSEQWIDSNSKNCPQCNASIEKSSGCNKMTCWKCNSYFCWLCLNVLNPALPYIHFNKPGSNCFNRLFEGIDPNEEEDEDDELWFDLNFDDL